MLRKMIIHRHKIESTAYRHVQPRVSAISCQSPPIPGRYPRHSIPIHIPRSNPPIPFPYLIDNQTKLYLSGSLKYSHH